MKSIGSMMVLLVIGSLASSGWSGAQSPSADSNQVAASNAPVFIEVEARIVELNQEDLGELGGEWNIGSKQATTNSRSITPKDKQIDSNSLASRISGLLTDSSVLTDSEVSLILHALEQRGGCNLLSAPKVTTRSGENAEIKVVREIRYPAAYEMRTVVLDKKSGQISLLATNESVSTSNRVMVAVAVPEFKTRDTGVILNVTPTAARDGKTIYLTLKPEVVELVEWIDYGYTLSSADGSSQQVKMLQPVFHSRNASSQIAIWDGQTVVMGGLITETRVDDQSGEGPWFSRWLGSKPERKTIRTNLLILVTARRVDGAGKPIDDGAKEKKK
ncbi:MAG: hypothetical protein HYV35_02490 [Lentisphaerae bacterium]|nr:hypothetical protein [Lentisphaerota bacterium]